MIIAIPHVQYQVGICDHIPLISSSLESLDTLINR